MAITSINSIKTSLKTLVQTVTSFTELNHVTDALKETYKTASSKYGVRSLSVAEVDGHTRAFMVDIPYEVTLCKSFVSSNQSDNADDIETELQQYHMDIYKQAQLTKINANANVSIVNNLAISESEIDYDNRIVIVKATFIVKVDTNVG